MSVWYHGALAGSSCLPACVGFLSFWIVSFRVVFCFAATFIPVGRFFFCSVTLFFFFFSFLPPSGVLIWPTVPSCPYRVVVLFCSMSPLLPSVSLLRCVWIVLLEGKHSPLFCELGWMDWCIFWWIWYPAKVWRRMSLQSIRLKTVFVWIGWVTSLFFFFLFFFFGAENECLGSRRECVWERRREKKVLSLKPLLSECLLSLCCNHPHVDGDSNTDRLSWVDLQLVSYVHLVTPLCPLAGPVIEDQESKTALNLHVSNSNTNLSIP